MRIVLVNCRNNIFYSNSVFSPRCLVMGDPNLQQWCLYDYSAAPKQVGQLKDLDPKYQKCLIDASNRARSDQIQHPAQKTTVHEVPTVVAKRNVKWTIQNKQQHTE